MRYTPMPYGNGVGILFGIAGFVGTLLLIALVVVLVVYFARRGKHPQAGPGPGPVAPPALQILDERLARGDLEIQDYLNRKAALMGQDPQSSPWTPTPSPEVPTTDQPGAPGKD
jgi:putative membrane protein